MRNESARPVDNNEWDIKSASVKAKASIKEILEAFAGTRCLKLEYNKSLII